VAKDVDLNFCNSYRRVLRTCGKAWVDATDLVSHFHGPLNKSGFGLAVSPPSKKKNKSRIPTQMPKHRIIDRVVDSTQPSHPDEESVKMHPEVFACGHQQVHSKRNLRGKKM
jgi:hypothetical protein